MLDEEQVEVSALELLPVDLGLVRRLSRGSYTDTQEKDGGETRQKYSDKSHGWLPVVYYYLSATISQALPCSGPVAAVKA
jgi:hypothetical protein